MIKDVLNMKVINESAQQLQKSLKITQMKWRHTVMIVTTLNPNDWLVITDNSTPTI